MPTSYNLFADARVATVLFLFISELRASIFLRVRSFGMIRNRISDPRSHGSLPIKGAGESLLRADSPAPLMHSDPSDLGSLILIRIISKERTLKLLCLIVVARLVVNYVIMLE